jgi:hypothetical protein
MPFGGIGSQRFELRRVDYLSPRSDGRMNAISAGWPLWTASWTFTGMNEAKAQEWESWINSLRGPQRLFYGRDLRSDLPLAYRKTGLGAFNGDATGWTVNTDRDVLTLTLPAGFVISAGDMIGFRWGDKRALVRAVESGIGPSAALTVEPAVPTVVPSNAVAYLSAPTCLMRLAPETELGEVGVDRMLTGRIAAVQELLA